MQALNGLRVVELGTHVAIPKASRVLSQWGAESIKVEPPKGEAWRTMGKLWNMPFDEDNNPIFQSENANKKSVSLNLKSEEGKEAMLKLLETADVFLTNTRPKALRKLGIDYESIKDRFPKLIYATLSGYGELGPDKDDPGFDIAAFWARSGVCTEWTVAGNRPFKPHPGFGDTETSWAIVSGVLAALLNREKTGKGEFIQTSLFGNALWCNTSGVAMAQRGHTYPKALNQVPSPIAPLYETKDGDWVLVSTSNYDEKAPELLKAIGHPEYAEDEMYTSVVNTRKHMDEVVGVYTDGIKKQSTEEIISKFKALDVVTMKIRNPEEVVKDEQAWANGYLKNVKLECGEEIALPQLPLQFENLEVSEQKLAPHLGVDTAEVLKSIGYTDEQIKALNESGAILAK